MHGVSHIEAHSRREGAAPQEAQRSACTRSAQRRAPNRAAHLEIGVQAQPLQGGARPPVLAVLLWVGVERIDGERQAACKRFERERGARDRHGFVVLLQLLSMPSAQKCSLLRAPLTLQSPYAGLLFNADMSEASAASSELPLFATTSANQSKAPTVCQVGRLGVWASAVPVCGSAYVQCVGCVVCIAYTRGEAQKRLRRNVRRVLSRRLARAAAAPEAGRARAKEQQRPRSKTRRRRRRRRLSHSGA